MLRATTTVTVTNLAPVADADGPYVVTETAIITLTGSASSDPGGGDLSYAWDLDDDSLFDDAFTMTTSYSWGEPGTYIVSLVVTDSQGLADTDATTVTVTNLPPVADANGPYTGTAGSPVTLTAAGSWDPGGGPLTYTWDLDDDGWYDDANGEVVVYTWTVAGGHTAAVQVTDSQGATDTDAAPVSIAPAELDHIILSPQTAAVLAGQAQTYTVEAFDAYSNSRGDVTTQTLFSIVEGGHGGHWTQNVYVSHSHGDWTVRAVHSGTIVVTDTAYLTVLAPVLRLDKSADLDVVEAGAYLTYTLTCSNTGNLTATGVVVTDVLDLNVSYVTAVPAPGGGLPRTPFWSVGAIAPGERSQISLTVRVARPLTNGTMLTNTAWLNADWVGIDQTAPLSATEGTTVHSRPVLVITKMDSPDPVKARFPLAYTLVITNSGNENATSITVTEQYDSNVLFFRADPAPDPGTDDRIWTFPILPVDHSESIGIVVHVTDTLPVGTVLTNQVTLDSDQTTPVTATEVTSVTSASELDVEKVALPDENVEAGETLQYIIHYENLGTAPAEDVVITETYDSHVTFVSAHPAPEAGTENVWEIGDLDVGDFGIIAVWVRVDTPLPNGTVLTNLVTIDSTYTSSKTFIETTRVASAPALAFTIADRPDPVEPGDPLSYTLYYTNTGNADATGVVITATLDPEVSYVAASLPPAGGAGSTWYWEVDDIAGMDGDGGFGSGELVIYTAVTLPLTNSLQLDFAAQIGDAEGDLVPASAQTTVSSTAVLSFGKGDGVSTVYAGDRLTYTLTYANSGKENAYDIVITDTLPNYVQYIGCQVDGDDCGLVSPGGDEVVFRIPALIAQTDHQARLIVQVDDPLPAGAEFVVNRATMTASSLPALEAQDSDSIGTRPELTISVGHAPSLFSPKGQMVYQVTYGNVGRMHAEDVVITTMLPEGTTYVGGGWSSSDGQTYIYDVGDLPAGSTDNTIQFMVAYPDQPQIDQSEFNTPFTITGGGSAIGDNVNIYIGVPDLRVVDFTVDPFPLRPDVPVTFTAVLKNEGTGVAWNPANGGGFFVDVFTAPVPSYPNAGYSQKNIWAGVDPLMPGASYTLVMTVTRDFSTGQPTGPIQFTQEEIDALEGLYVKVDTDNLVPEGDEMNNVTEPSNVFYTYMPLILKNVGR